MPTDAAVHDRATPLESALAAVPDEIKTVRGWSLNQIAAEAERCADTIACGADALWHTQTPRKAETTAEQVGAAITTGLAILALRPDGVDFVGYHWCVTDHDDCLDDDGKCFLDAPVPDRSATGAWYTPRALAEEIAMHAIDAVTHDIGPLHTFDRDTWELAPLGWLLDLRIVDIACGAGAFLVAACRILADRLLATGYWTGPHAVYDARRAAMRALHGVDINPWSIELARLALQLLAPDAAPPQPARLIFGDALVGTTDPRCPQPRTFPTGAYRLDWAAVFPHVWPECGRRGFDVVIGNPPFLGGQKITSALGAPYREHLIKAIANGRRGSADLAAYFLLRAHQLLNRTHGVCGIVATNTLAQGDTCRVGLDQVVADGWAIYRSWKSRPWPTDSAAVHVCLVWTVADRDEEAAGGVTKPEQAKPVAAMLPGMEDAA